MNVFGTPSKSRHRTGCTTERKRIVRIAWLTAMLVSKRPVTSADYYTRFGLSRRQFERDKAVLADAGIRFVLRRGNGLHANTVTYEFIEFDDTQAVA